MSSRSVFKQRQARRELKRALCSEAGIVFLMLLGCVVSFAVGAALALV